MTDADVPPPGRFLAVLRIAAAALFLMHGVSKLWGIPGGDSVPLASLLGLAGVIEVLTGSMMLLGLGTRIAAIIASGEMAVAYWTAHAPASALPVLNGGDAAVLYCFIFLYLAVAGPGAFSLDGRFRPGRRPAAIRVRNAPFP